MNLPLFIAWRYLFARKSHNVINIISAISATGMAIGTAALIIILSIYNGFDSLVKSMLGNVEPDLLITSERSKTFVPEGSVYDWIYEQESVTSMCTVLQERVFISYDGRQGIAEAKGVDRIIEAKAMKEVTLEPRKAEDFFLCADGEIALCRKVTITAEPGGLRLIIPKKSVDNEI